MIDATQTRVAKLGEYLEKILNTLNTNYRKVNANFLDLEANNYSLDKIPTDSTIEEDIVGNKICRDVYSFRSRNAYSSDIINNLMNSGFFENFEKIISSNNEQGVLPDIEKIISIECLNCGAIETADINTCVFDIQIQITYEENNEPIIISL